MRSFWLVVLCSVVVTSGVAAQQQPRYKYLAEAVDRMITASEDTADPTPESVEAIAAIGCGALERLLADPLFWGDLDKLSKGLLLSEWVNLA